MVEATNEGDDVLENNSSTDTITVDCPDVSVLKTGNGPLSAGDTAEWTIVVANDGDGDATGVTLTDTLPTGVTWTIDSIDGVDYGDIVDPDCAIAAGELSCDFGTMASGDEHTLVLSGVVDAGECPEIENTAVVEATNEGDDVLENNSSTDTITVNCGDISVTKTADPEEPVSAGATIGFDILVENLGLGDADDVALNDTLPPDLDWEITAIDGVAYGDIVDPDCAIAAGELTCDFGTMGPGDSHLVEIEAVTDAADCGLITNTAFVTTSNDGDSQSTATVQVDCPDVSVLKTGNGPLSAGDTAEWTIVVANDGDGDATGVTLTDTLPTGVTWTIDSIDGVDYGDIVDPDCAIAAGELSCDFGTMASGDEHTLVLSGVVDAGECPEIENTAVVEATNEGDDVLENNSSTDTIDVNCPSIDVEKTPDEPLVDAAEEIGF